MALRIVGVGLTAAAGGLSSSFKLLLCCYRRRRRARPQGAAGVRLGVAAIWRTLRVLSAKRC